MELLQEISRTLQAGDDQKIVELTKQAIAAEISAKDILDNGLIAGMNVVGEKFRTREFFLPDVLLAAKSMNAAMDLVKPLLVGDQSVSMGKVVIGTVQGDLHDIGKNLVGVMLKGAGFEVIDLGHDVPPQKFIDTVVAEQATVLGMSALLTTTMAVMKQVIDLLEEKGLKGKVRTIVGGAPVTREFAQEIGATSYGYDAANAVSQIKDFFREA